MKSYKYPVQSSVFKKPAWIKHYNTMKLHEMCGRQLAILLENMHYPNHVLSIDLIGMSKADKA